MNLILPFSTFFLVFLLPLLSQQSMETLGGLHESQSCQNINDLKDLGRFTVEEHNKKENVMVEFARVVKAEEQVVADALQHLTLEAIEAGQKKIYKANVWVKPLLNFKELFRTVHDLAVQDAANHVITTLQKTSNSLFPYELQEVVHVRAKVMDDFAKFDMLLKGA